LAKSVNPCKPTFCPYAAAGFQPVVRMTQLSAGVLPHATHEIRYANLAGAKACHPELVEARAQRPAHHTSTGSV